MSVNEKLRNIVWIIFQCCSLLKQTFTFRVCEKFCFGTNEMNDAFATPVATVYWLNEFPVSDPRLPVLRCCCPAATRPLLGYGVFPSHFSRPASTMPATPRALDGVGFLPHPEDDSEVFLS